MIARIVALAMLSLAYPALSAGILPAKETDQVADRLSPVQPGQLHLGGWLGNRIDANRTHWLLTADLDARLRPFATHNEGGGWSGEHIGKWLHAASINWAYSHDPALRKRIDDAVATLAAAQQPDGYLGTYSDAHRWGGWDVWTHKYNLIGLVTAYQYTGNAQALAAARRIGDLLIRTFGPERRDIIRAGEHVGMAATSVLEGVVLLYRATGDPRYLDFARYIVQAYDQPHGPKIVATLLATHSVAKTANRKAYEMMSNLVGLCELYRATGDRRLLDACIFAHDDIVENQMYLTGGVSLGECFQDPHHLPNTGDVSENCAQVTWMQLAIQLLRLTGEAKYADTIERVAYNHLLAAQKPSGDRLCYFTPLEGKKPYTADINCCTSSGPRGISLLTTVAYMLGKDAVAVNFYEPSTFDVSLAGTPVKLAQKTRYPLDGNVEISVDPQRPVRFTLLARIPGWCPSYRATVEGERFSASTTGSSLEPAQIAEAISAGAHLGDYVSFDRVWQQGDRVVLQFEMPALLIKGKHTDQGLVAVQRGPLVLAFDERLNPGLSATSVTPVVESDGTLKLTPATDPQGLAAHVFLGQGLTSNAVNEKAAPRTVPLVWTSFAEAGQTGSSYAVWLPSADRLKNTGGK
jgi:DUF1680 family protein